jgi:hypothetical protein
MEQQLINALVKLIAKAGGASLMKDMIQQIDTNGNPKVWTAAEVEAAVRYVDIQTENFGTAEAIIMIQTLLKKYNLRMEDFQTTIETPPNNELKANELPEAPGVHGLN